jgi:hypothetical protein
MAVSKTSKNKKQPVKPFTLQTANPVFDIAVGMHREYVMTSAGPIDTGTGEPTPLHQSEDGAGKLSFASYTPMMREKKKKKPHL